MSSVKHPEREGLASGDLSQSAPLRYPVPFLGELLDQDGGVAIVKERGVQQLRELDYFAIGVVAAVMDQSGERALVFEHKARAKTLAGAIGPPAETTKGQVVDSSLSIEDPYRTLRRCLDEEICIKVADEQPVYVPNRQSITAYNWPVGNVFPGRFSFAICPIVFVDKLFEDAINTKQAPSREVRRAYFLPLTTLIEHRETRPGVRGWAEHIRSRMGAIAIADEGIRATTFAALSPPDNRLASPGNSTGFDMVLDPEHSEIPYKELTQP